MIMISITLKEGGTWWLKQLANHQELITTLNTGLLEGNQLAAMAFNLEGFDVVYDFVAKGINADPFKYRKIPTTDKLTRGVL